MLDSYTQIAVSFMMMVNLKAMIAVDPGIGMADMIIAIAGDMLVTPW